MQYRRSTPGEASIVYCTTSTIRALLRFFKLGLQSADTPNMQIPTQPVLYALLSMSSPRIAMLGEWPSWVDPAALVERLPGLEAGAEASGFDAGIACALGLIPPDKQRLSARLHAAYAPDAVGQIRSEIEHLDPESETAWWLAACSVCEEGKLTFDQFTQQLAAFELLRADAVARREAAAKALAAMQSDFELDADGTAFAIRDGGMQGAYIAGREFAGAYNDQLDLFFIGTFHPTLGLESFDWRCLPDPEAADLQDRLGRSGPVHGSRQYVKCVDRSEYDAAMRVVRAHFAT